MLLSDTSNIELDFARPGFEQLYIKVREQEQRLYSDEQVMLLPHAGRTDAHYKEWLIRGRSAKKLSNYLIDKRKNLQILEVGCGNGWLSAQLSLISGADVTGLDINKPEIDQAKRIFRKDNLRFINSTLNNLAYKEQQYDVVVFAASLQYFPSVVNVLNDAYTAANVKHAVMRTRDYYAGMGYPELAGHYFHHQLTDLDSFDYQVRSNPTSVINRLSGKSPFYWISINKQQL